MRSFDGIIDSRDMSLSKLQKTVEDGEAWRAAVYSVAERGTTQQLTKDNCVRQVGSFSKKLNKYFPYYPTIPLLEIYQREGTKTCRRMFTVVLFVRANIGGKPKCPSMMKG